MTTNNTPEVPVQSTVSGTTPEVPATTVVPPVVSPEIPPKVEAQPLTPEAIQKMISDGIQAGLSQIDYRKLQSVNDRLIAKKPNTEVIHPKIRQRILAQNPDFEQELRLAEYEARDEADKVSEQETEQQRRAEETAKQTNDALLTLLQDSGIDPKDSRLDWGLGEKIDYATGLSRFNKSVAKIIKERDAQKETAITARLKQQEADIEARLRKSLGIETVNTGGGGVITDDIPTNMAKFKEWVKSLPQEEYEKKADKIKAMLNENKIN
jgi:hypothetical protein